MRTLSKGLAAAMTMAVLGSTAAFGQVEKGKAVTTFWTFPKGQQAITLLVQGKAEPVTFNVSPDMPFGGVCMHCTLNQAFKVSEAKMTCKPCGCGKTNAVCTSWKDLKQATWEELIANLPLGIVLRASFNTPDDPASGLKGLWIDRRTIYVPVDGLAGKSAGELTAIAKAVGGSKAELTDGDKRLVINLKTEYDAESVAKLTKAIEKAGAKIVRPEAPAAAAQ